VYGLGPRNHALDDEPTEMPSGVYGYGPRNHAVDDEPTEMPCGPRFACGLYYYHHYYFYYYHHHHYTSGVHVSKILKRGPRVERRRRAGQGTEGWVQEGSPSRWGRGLGCPLPRNFIFLNENGVLVHCF